MIYVDTSVVLAHLLRESRVPDAGLWNATLVSSRLLEYELWNRLHAHALTASHGDAARAVLARFVLIELTPAVLSRALAPFQLPVRTLDALHLASVAYLVDQRRPVSLATYDRRMQDAAEAMQIPVVAL